MDIHHDFAKQTGSNIARDAFKGQAPTGFVHLAQQTLLALSIMGVFFAPLLSQADELLDEDPPVPVDQAVINSLEPDQVLVYVRGMVCGMCVQGITKLLTKLPGVKTVEIDLETGAVLIRVREKQPPTDPQIKEAIKGAGYEAQDIFRSSPSPKETIQDSSSQNTKTKTGAEKQAPSKNEQPAAKSESKK